MQLHCISPFKVPKLAGMKLLVFLSLLVASILAKFVHPPGGAFAPKCLVGSGIYEPSKAVEVPWLTVDLDLPYDQRYRNVVGPFADDMRRVISIVKGMATIFGGSKANSSIDQMMGYAYEHLFPYKYKEEIRGISEATNISTSDLALMNIFYELSRYCTSIIAETFDGQLFHARNLDFGQLFLWDKNTQSWALTDSLKKVTVNIRFVKNNQTLFLGTTFVGHTGIITGMKPHAFTISMDAKAFVPDSQQLTKWFSGGYNNTDVHFAMWAEREIMENCSSYQEAKEYLSTIVQLAGCYYILGGNSSSEGVILVRNATGVTTTVQLDPDQPDKWYILQTNYDPDQLPMFLDDRRDPGNKCMKQLGRGNVSAEGIYEVLSSKTTLNKTTVIMSVATGLYQTFIQYCPNPCWPF